MSSKNLFGTDPDPDQNLSPDVKTLLGETRQGHVCTNDGVDICYQSFGKGPAVVLANGIGVRYLGFAKQIAALRNKYQLICWDYRGMGKSKVPHTCIDVSMSRQAQDVLCILDHLKIDKIIFVGWSMGVQVGLEVLRAQPMRVNGFVALLGAYGQPFRNGMSFLGPYIKSFFGLLERIPVAAQIPLELATALPPIAFKVLSTISFVGTDADRQIFDGDVKCVNEVEKKIYLRTIRALGEHDAFDVLPTIKCPSLIVAGTKDWLTPPDVAKRMASTIDGAIYKEIPDGTHFALIEQADLVNSWLVDFADSVYSRSDFV